MKKDIMKKWVKALRSGKYKQGTGRLKSLSGEQHCCLGVLCEVLGMKSYVGRDSFDGQVFGRNSRGLLPPTAMRRSGIRSLNGLRQSINNDPPLTELNDATSLSFAEIADYIEQHYLDL